LFGADNAPRDAGDPATPLNASRYRRLSFAKSARLLSPSCDGDALELSLQSNPDQLRRISSYSFVLMPLS